MAASFWNLADYEALILRPIPRSNRSLIGELLEAFVWIFLYFDCDHSLAHCLRIFDSL